MSNIINDVDVICEMKPLGDVIPIKFRIQNEDGEYETYIVKSYRQIFRQDTYTTPDGVTVSAHDLVFECNIIVLGVTKRIRLYLQKDKLKWRLSV